MADQLQEFPIARRKKQRRYPWDQWTDGAAWRLVRFEDYDQETNEFRYRLYPQAKRRGLKVRSTKQIEMIPDSKGTEAARETLVIEFYDPSEIDGTGSKSKNGSRPKHDQPPG